MKLSDFGRYALGSCVAALLLAACGGSQPPIGAPGAMVQTSAIATRAERGKSWMLPEAKSEDLLYASDGQSSAYVFSYPAGKLVGELTGFSAPLYECSDSKGDVFITNFEGTQGVDEYAHGATEPMAVFQVPEASGCSVDPTTGNLAVGSNSDVLYVFPDAEGTPIEYTDTNISSITDVAYDDSGNLFLDGAQMGKAFPFLLELPNGSGGFETINVPASIDDCCFQLQWDGDYLAAGSIYREGHNPRQTILNRLQISGSTATVVGTVKLAFQLGSWAPQFWIQGDAVIQPSDRRYSSNVEYFTYPRGKVMKRFKVDKSTLWGATISLAKSRTRSRK